jgi:glutaredoxin-related protein
MLTPTWLAEDAPHFLRAVGVLPLLVIFPALGLDAAMAWLEQRELRGWAIAVACSSLAIGLVATGWDYFFRYGADPQTAYAFEDAATQLAAEANRFVGSGWDGSGLVAREGNPRPGQRVYVDSRLWDEWAAIPFLVPETGIVIRLPTESPPLEGGAGGGTLLLLWPYDGVEHHLDLLPRNARIETHAGPLAQGDLEDAPYTAYVAYTADPRATRPAGHLAHFGGQIALTDYAVEVSDQEWRVRLEWEALVPSLKNYTVFVHLRDGERVVDQKDGEPAGGYYPTRLWRSGDVVVDTHVLEPSKKWKDKPQLVVGLYVWPTMERLEVVTPSGEPLGDELVLPNQ